MLGHDCSPIGNLRIDFPQLLPSEESRMKEEILRKMTLTLQIISVALMSGLAVFGVFAFSQASQGAAPDPERFPVVGAMAAFMMASCLAVGWFITNHFTQSSAKAIADGTWIPPQNLPAKFESDEEKLLIVRQNTHIIRMALVEGPGFMAAISVMLERHLAVLLLVAFALGIMAFWFPTIGKTRNWVEEKLRLVQQYRSGMR